MYKHLFYVNEINDLTQKYDFIYASVALNATIELKLCMHSVSFSTQFFKDVMNEKKFNKLIMMS